MNNRRVLIALLVAVLHQSQASVNVGANLGIPGLFQPSTEYHYVKQSYPYYLDEYPYQQPDKNYFEAEDPDVDIDIMNEIRELDEIDRQVSSPGIVDQGGQLFGDLTPLLFTSALVVGLR